jgi:hypothetical protein
VEPGVAELRRGESDTSVGQELISKEKLRPKWPAKALL